MRYLKFDLKMAYELSHCLRDYSVRQESQNEMFTAVIK